MKLTVLQKLKQDIQQSQLLSSDTKIIVSSFIFNALEDEKEQIETAFDTGMNNSVDFYIPYASGDERIPECENYYKQTFKND